MRAHFFFFFFFFCAKHILIKTDSKVKGLEMETFTCGIPLIIYAIIKWLCFICQLGRICASNVRLNKSVLRYLLSNKRSWNWGQREAFSLVKMELSKPSDLPSDIVEGEMYRIMWGHDIITDIRFGVCMFMCCVSVWIVEIKHEYTTVKRYCISQL